MSFTKFKLPSEEGTKPCEQRSRLRSSLTNPQLFPARVLLRDFRLSLVSVFLLLLQFAVNVPIGRRGGNFASLRAGVGSGWQAIFPRFFCQ